MDETVGCDPNARKPVIIVNDTVVHRANCGATVSLATGHPCVTIPPFLSLLVCGGLNFLNNHSPKATDPLGSPKEATASLSMASLAFPNEKFGIRVVSTDGIPPAPFVGILSLTYIQSEDIRRQQKAFAGGMAGIGAIQARQPPYLQWLHRRRTLGLHRVSDGV